MKRIKNISSKVREAIDNSVDGTVDLSHLKINNRESVYNAFFNYGKRVKDYNVIWPKEFQPRKYKKMLVNSRPMSDEEVKEYGLTVNRERDYQRSLKTIKKLNEEINSLKREIEKLDKINKELEYDNNSLRSDMESMADDVALVDHLRKENDKFRDKIKSLETDLESLLISDKDITLIREMKCECIKCGSICESHNSITGEIVFVCRDCDSVYVYDDNKFDKYVKYKKVTE